MQCSPDDSGCFEQPIATVADRSSYADVIIINLDAREMQAVTHSRSHPLPPQHSDAIVINPDGLLNDLHILETSDTTTIRSDKIGFQATDKILQQGQHGQQNLEVPQDQHIQQEQQNLEVPQEQSIKVPQTDQQDEDETTIVSNENNNPPSPQCIDEAIQDQGRDLLQLLQLFKEANSDPLSSCILQTPKNKTKQNQQLKSDKANVQPNQRKSLRLQEKGTKNKSIKMAQKLVAKKCGIIHDEEDLDNITLQQYLDMYNHPLNDDSIEAISKVSEVTNDAKSSYKRKDQRIFSSLILRWADLCLLVSRAHNSRH
jgi:hypothetical protein